MSKGERTHGGSKDPILKKEKLNVEVEVGERTHGGSKDPILQKKKNSVEIVIRRFHFSFGTRECMHFSASWELYRAPVHDW